jgi:peptidoglycan hydrolase CwlO-like protein
MSSLGSSIPEISSKLSAIQSEENANNSLLQKLQPEISAVSAMNSRLASMESTITSLPADFTDALKALQAQIPSMLANFGASLKNLPVFQSLMKDESSIANQVNTSYLIVKTLGSSIEANIDGAVGADYNKIVSLIKQFQTALNVLQANISALPSDLRTGVVNSLTPELKSIEGDISPIISTVDANLSPIENNINSIKSSISGLSSGISSIGSDVRSAVYSIF